MLTIFCVWYLLAHGIWGMMHKNVKKGGYTTDLRVVRMASVKVEEKMPILPRDYDGYFKLATPVNKLMLR